MKILTVSFFDDNFGDMLIRICFDRLVRTALPNLLQLKHVQFVLAMLI